MLVLVLLFLFEKRLQFHVVGLRPILTEAGVSCLGQSKTDWRQVGEIRDFLRSEFSTF